MPLSAHTNNYLIKLIIPLNKTGLLPGPALREYEIDSLNYESYNSVQSVSIPIETSHYNIIILYEDFYYINKHKKLSTLFWLFNK